MTEYDYIYLKDIITEENAPQMLNEIIQKFDHILVEPSSLVHCKELIGTGNGNRGATILYNDGNFDWWYSIISGWKIREQ